jgi:RNase P protein component
MMDPLERAVERTRIKRQIAAAVIAVEREQSINWAVSRWQSEVAKRPLWNVHRRTLDDTWRQVIRHFGGDDEALCGPRHDELIGRTSDVV